MMYVTNVMMIDVFQEPKNLYGGSEYTRYYCCIDGDQIGQLEKQGLTGNKTGTGTGMGTGICTKKLHGQR